MRCGAGTRRPDGTRRLCFALIRPRRQSGSGLGKTIWEALEAGAPGERDAAGGTDPPGAEIRPPAQTPRED
jgi:hypothetical protein